MAIELQKVLDKIKETHESLKQHVDSQLEEMRKEGFENQELNEKIDRINADLTEYRSQYDELVLSLKRPSFDNNSVPLTDDEKRSQAAFDKFVRYGFGETGKAHFTAEEIRALSPSSDGAGQFLVPTAWESELIVAAYNQAEIRPICNVAPTGRDAVFMPALQKPSVAWGNANLEVSPQDLAAGGQRLEIFDLRALILIHNNTLEDAEADIWSELRMQGSLAVAEAEDDAFSIGAGNESPKGIFSDTRVQANYTPTGVAAAIYDATHNGVDALTDMYYGVKKTYRRMGTWAMNSLTESAVRKLKNTTGDYLWQPPVQAGDPPTLLGRPVINPEGAPDIAANSFPIAFGDFRRGYKIRDRRGITVQRLVERYAEFNQTGFMLTRRIGGQVTLPEAFALLKVAAS